MFTGQILDGRYEILKEIGRGGMARVYLAMDVRLQKSWAVKEIRKDGQDGEHKVAVSSLLAEAEMMKKLDHPALPRIVDIIDRDESVCIVLDYVTGESLDRLLKRQKSFPEDQVMNWFLQLAEVLEYLHRQNPPIIYRDMKPGNIMQTPEGFLKLIDFGIAREYKYKNQTDTIALGTNGYAAPEQYTSARGAEPGVRSDVYSLAATAVKMLTGNTPPRPEQIFDHPESISVPTIPPYANAAIARAMAYDMTRRTPSVAEFFASFSDAEHTSIIPQPRRRHSVWAILANILLLCILAVVALCAIDDKRLYSMAYYVDKQAVVAYAVPTVVSLAALCMRRGVAKGLSVLLALLSLSYLLLQ